MLSVNMNNRRCRCDDLGRRLQEVNFALYDTVLYLDAYPNCRKALAHYHSLLELQRQLAAEYEKDVGPLTPFGNTCRERWDWTATPWPWEQDGSCN